MDKTKINHLYTVLFFGSLWGLLEATVGALLHEFKLPTGLVLYPLGFFFMLQGFRNTGQKRTIFLIACVAAAVKALNYLIPGVTSIITGAVIRCILFEGLTTAICLPLLLKSPLLLRSALALGASFGWRILHVGLPVVAPFIYTNFWENDPDRMLSFFVFQVSVNALLVVGLSYPPHFIKTESLQQRRSYPLIIVASLLAALAVQFIF